MSEKVSAGVDLDARSAAYAQLIKGDIKRVVLQHDPYLAEDLDALVDELMAARAVVEVTREHIEICPETKRRLLRDAIAEYDRLTGERQ